MASGVRAAPPRPTSSLALHRRACLASCPQRRGQQRRSPRGWLPGARTPLCNSGRSEQVSPPAARELPAPSALTPGPAVDPSATHAGPLSPLSDSRGSALKGRTGPRPVLPAARERGAGRSLPLKTAPFLRPGVGYLQEPPGPSLSLRRLWEGRGRRRGAGWGWGCLHRLQRGRPGRRRGRPGPRPLEAHSPLRNASGRAPLAEAVAASQGPKAARLRVFSLHSPNTQEITERQVTARSQ